MTSLNRTSLSMSLPKTNTRMQSQGQIKIDPFLTPTFSAEMKQQIQQLNILFSQELNQTIEQINLFKKYVVDQFDELQVQLYSQSQMSPISSIIDEQQTRKPIANQNKDSFLSDHSIDSLADFLEEISKSVCLRIKTMKVKDRSKSLIIMKAKEQLGVNAGCQSIN